MQARTPVSGAEFWKFFLSEKSPIPACNRPHRDYTAGVACEPQTANPNEDEKMKTITMIRRGESGMKIKPCKPSENLNEDTMTSQQQQVFSAGVRCAKECPHRWEGGQVFDDLPITCLDKDSKPTTARAKKFIEIWLAGFASVLPNYRPR